MKTFGCQSMYAPIRRMVLKHPREAFISQANLETQWEKLVYFGCPDFENSLAEYERFSGILEQFDFEIHYAPKDETTSLDSIYAHDPLVISNRGAILCSMGKEARKPEADAAEKYLQELGVPVIGRIQGSGKLEGGDVLWVDERTLAVGQGFRTNAEGLRQLRELLGDSVDEIYPVQLPYWTGPQDCLHLLSFISIVDKDLAVVHSRLMPVPFREWLLERGFQFVEVPNEEYDSLGCNVLAVGPRQCVMLNGNPVTQKRLEEAGAQVWTFDGKDISYKGTGGPTCLTRPILRMG
ncbi:arginine deiminase family protein [Candidatus Villigracilis affinis]|uniref:dimethylarginine dimethylaminohydrolase family protein n=1 Tax=Candidatus Villigracilis affinis TaxID=3140682 RepID=UPI0031E7E1DC